MVRTLGLSRLAVLVPVLAALLAACGGSDTIFDEGGAAGSSAGAGGTGGAGGSAGNGGVPDGAAGTGGIVDGAVTDRLLGDVGLGGDASRDVGLDVDANVSLDVRVDVTVPLDVRLDVDASVPLDVSLDVRVDADANVIPDVSIDGTLPDATLPDVIVPDVTLPDVTLPDVTLPDVTLLDVNLDVDASVSIDASLDVDAQAFVDVNPDAFTDGGPPAALGAAETFAVFAGASIANVGASIVNGDLGGTFVTVTGTPPVVLGVTHLNDTLAGTAENDINTAFNELAGRACPPANALTGFDLGGRTLTPGVYCFTSGAPLNGILTLDGQNNPNAVWVFQIASTLVTGNAAVVRMINGGSECNVYWKVGSSATIGGNTLFGGNILALDDITVQMNANIVGRAFSLAAGAVSLSSNLISIATCPGGPIDGGLPDVDAGELDVDAGLPDAPDGG